MTIGIQWKASDGTRSQRIGSIQELNRVYNELMQQGITNENIYIGIDL